MVKKCTLKESGEEFAVKIMKNYDEERVLAAENEFNLLLAVNHPNIVSVKEILKTEKEIYMVMEFIKGEEMMDRITEIDKYDENIAKRLFRQILDAIKYLHDRRICHRDIKPSNIMVLKGEDKIKLADFNVSRKVTNDSFSMMTHTGTEAFSAPEMFSGVVYDNSVDIWSAGCVLYTMLAGYMPFFEENNAKL